MGRLIQGAGIAEEILSEVRAGVDALREHSDVAAPRLAVVRMGGDPWGLPQAEERAEAALRAGIEIIESRLPEMSGANTVCELLESLSADTSIHGILIEPPIPRHLDSEEVGASISLEKDVDGLNSVNRGRLLTGRDGLIPALPLGVLELLRRSGVRIAGQKVVVLGGGLLAQILGLLLSRQQAAVTLCSARVAEIEGVTNRADVLVVAVGSPRFLRWDMVRDGAVVVDAGANLMGDRLVGDVDFPAVRSRASAITPVPGGVGPVTVAAVLLNTLRAAETALRPRRPVLEPQ